MFPSQQFEFEVIASGLQYPEGPAFLSDGSLAVVEVKGGNLVRFAQSAGAWTKQATVPLGGSPNGAAPGPDNSLWICNSGGFEFLSIPLSANGLSWTLNVPTVAPSNYTGGSLQKVDLATNAVSTVCPSNSVPQGLRGPDDLVFDSAGGLWFNDYGKTIGSARDITGVYYLPAGSQQPILKIPNRISPNGIALSPAGDCLYVAETNSRWVMSWQLDPAQPGTIIPSKATLDGSIPLAPMPEFGEPDSMALDEEGNLYVATLVTKGLSPVTPGGITVFSPDGKQLQYIPINTPIPDPLPSNICFGGPDRKTAFITLGGTGQIVTCRMPIAGLRHQFSQEAARWATV